MGATKKVDGVLHLWGKFVPLLDREVGIGHAQSLDEAILECLDGSVCGIDTMVMWFNKLEAGLLRSEVSFDDYCCLVVHHIQFWPVAHFLKMLEILLKHFQDAGGIETGNWGG